MENLILTHMDLIFMLSFITLHTYRQCYVPDYNYDAIMLMSSQ